MKRHVIPLWYAVLCMMIFFSAFQPAAVYAAKTAGEKVELNHTSLTLTVGDEPVTLTAKVLPEKANQEVRWTSVNPAVAKVSEEGKVTPLSEGKTTIVATSLSGGKTAFCTVTVHPQYKKVTGLTLDKAALTLTVGKDPATLVPRIQPNNATNQKVNWVSTNPTVAKVDANGKVTPVAIGSATVIATTVDGGYTAACQVKVVGVAVTGISLNQKNVTLSHDGSITLRATVLPIDASNKNVKWSSSNTAVATVNSSGTVIARSTGTAMITAETEDGKKKAYATVTVISRITNVFIEWESDSKVTVTWNGTSGSVKAQLKKGSHLEKSVTTSSRKATFSNLEKYTQYGLYIDGQYIKSFRIYDLVNRDVEDLVFKRNDSSSVTATWRGTSGSVKIELKKDDRVVDSVTTSRRSVTFDDLDDDVEYNLYIDGKYAGSFTIEDLNQVKNFDLKNVTASSVSMSWDGTTGSVEVELRKNNRKVDSLTTRSRYASFSHLDADTRYEIYIDDAFIRSFKTDDYKPQTFWDIRNHWARQDIENLVTLGILEGFPDGTFRPDQTVSKEEFVTMLVRAREYTIQKGSTGFRDISSDRWSAPFIYTAIKQNIIVSDDYGSRFNPNHAATREEMAVMAARALKLRANSSAADFTDRDQIDNKGLVGAAVKAKIIYGYPDHSFRPNASLTRAEAAAVINRVIRY
ncbi:Ig-like domain-containing protein [Ammoniphilus resinae]|uniref:Uncharacterized protein YjdB n=1 Tax=Ammoniphilus resinae TaxID=861532 RepID=A0ABS4GIS8_9BACL|nr:Ig-like domain-containing protein [Ammoniphilus resinae]MBP1930156.1 uncharacterized protein YjdB [Ammoniphilus resinae]